VRRSTAPTVLLGAAGRDHDDGDIGAGAQRATGVPTRTQRQHQVEQDQVRAGLLGQRDAVLAGLGRVDMVARVLERAADDVGHDRVVLHDQDGQTFPRLLSCRCVCCHRG